MKKKVPNSSIFILVATRKDLADILKNSYSLTYTDQIKTTGKGGGGGGSCIHVSKKWGGKLHGSSEKFWLCQKVCMPRDEL